MEDFKPTWLYVKQHNNTGLKYFGKTTSKDPVLYPGSGLYWSRHLKKNGKDVDTIWYQLFEDRESLISYATNFSKENDIVNSTDWANLKDEDGLMGGNHNRFTEDGRRRLSEKSKKFRHTEETKEKLRIYRKNQSDPRLGKKHTDETKNKLREARKLQVTSAETRNKISESIKLKWAQRKALQEV